MDVLLDIESRSSKTDELAVGAVVVKVEEEEEVGAGAVAVACVAAADDDNGGIAEEDRAGKFEGGIRVLAVVVSDLLTGRVGVTAACRLCCDCGEGETEAALFASAHEAGIGAVLLRGKVSLFLKSSSPSET